MSSTQAVTMEMLDSVSMRKIFRYELRRVRQQDREDVKHNCIVEILKAVQRNPNALEAKNFSSFCHVIIKRTIVDYYRYSNRQISKATMYVNFNDGDPEENESNLDNFFCIVPDLGYSIAELRLDYQKHRHLFSKNDKKVLDFIFYDTDSLGMNFSDIACKLDINKSSVTRAIKKFREICCNDSQAYNDYYNYTLSSAL